MPHPLTPPPLRSWPAMPVPWQHWFHTLWQRTGGSTDPFDDPAPGESGAALLGTLGAQVAEEQLRTAFVDGAGLGEERATAQATVLLAVAETPAGPLAIPDAAHWLTESAPAPQRTEQTAEQELAHVLAYF